MKPQDTHAFYDVITDEATAGIPADLDVWPRISRGLLVGGSVAGKRSASIRRLTWPRVRLGGMRVGAIVVLALIVLIVGTPRVDQSGSAAAALLNDLATVARAQAAPLPLAAGSYVYTREESMYTSTLVVRGGETITALVPKTRSMWVAADGSGRIQEAAGEPIFLSERSRTAWSAAGSPPLARPINRDFDAGGLSYEDPGSLPSNPGALATVVRQRAEGTGVPVDVEMFIVIGDLLRQQSSPPEVRAALYQLATTIPSVDLIGARADHAGRPGVAIGKVTDHFGGRQSLVLIFDPRNSALLGEERVLLDAASWVDTTPPVVISYAVYLESGIVDTLPQ